MDTMIRGTSVYFLQDLTIPTSRLRHRLHVRGFLSWLRLLRHCRHNPAACSRGINVKTMAFPVEGYKRATVAYVKDYDLNYPTGW